MQTVNDRTTGVVFLRGTDGSRRARERMNEMAGHLGLKYRENAQAEKHCLASKHKLFPANIWVTRNRCGVAGASENRV